MTYLRIVVAQLLFHDEVYLLSSLSIWRKVLVADCFFLVEKAAMTEAPPERSDSEVRFRDAYFREDG